MRRADGQADRPALYEKLDDRFRTGRCMNGDAAWDEESEANFDVYEDGTLIGRLDLPESLSDIAWGGPKRNRLHSIVMGVTGTHPTGPGRPDNRQRH